MISMDNNENNRVKHSTLRQQVAEILRKDILHGRYLPGDRIVEADIASNFNISRGPVREAIRQLEEEGLVTYSNNKGCSVTRLEPMDAWEIYLLRANLESLACGLCNSNIGESAIREMEICIEKMSLAAEKEDLSEMVAQDHIFHSLICKAPNKKRLYKLWSSLNNTSYAIFLTIISANVSSLTDMPDKHKKLLDALKSNNQELASQAIKDHYLNTGRELLLNKK